MSTYRPGTGNGQDKPGISFHTSKLKTTNDLLCLKNSGANFNRFPLAKEEQFEYQWG